EGRQRVRGNNKTMVQVGSKKGRCAGFSKDEFASLAMMHRWSGTIGVKNHPGPAPMSIRSLLLLLLQVEEIRFIFDLRKILGSVFPGSGNADCQFLAIEFVDSLRRFALGFVRAIFDLKIECWIWLGFSIDFHFTRIIRSVNSRLELVPFEGPF